MLYSLCMKFQAELVNFQDQLENCVLCKTFPSRQNSEVQPSVTKHEEFKMHLNDIQGSYAVIKSHKSDN